MFHRYYSTKDEHKLISSNTLTSVLPMPLEEMGEIARIEDWNIVESSDTDCTAQKMSFRLRGQVYGHPKYADGVKITTSHISAVDGALTLCKNRLYLMGEPSQHYLAMLRAQGVHFNPETPLLPLLTSLKKPVGTDNN